MRRQLEFVYFEAGGGHRAAANALRHVVEAQQRPWDVRLMNLQEELDELDIFRKLTGIRMEDVYNLLLKKGWTLGTTQLLPFMHGIIRMYHPAQVRVLRRYWAARRPDMVVSLVPNFNRALCESLRAELPGTPLVTVLTDIADYPPHFWIERQEQYFVCGSDKALRQARELGHDEAHAFRASGMVIHPRFYDLPPVDRAAERRRLGLDPDLPTGMVMFGGEGSAWMPHIARRLDQSGLRLQLILVCGRNARIEAELRAMKKSVPMFVEGFTREVPRYMQLCDFFIGKPGPGSISEALHMGLPVIVERNSWTLPQERYNADWVRELGLGIVVKNFRRVETAVDELLRPETLKRFRENAARLDNRAVFEIPGILERIFARCERSLSSAR